MIDYINIKSESKYKKPATREEITITIENDLIAAFEIFVTGNAIFIFQTML